MSDTFELRSLYHQLERDVWRDDHPFSEDIIATDRVLTNPYSNDGNRSEAMSLWLQKNQPCLFGRIAARDFMHFCFLTDLDVQSSDRLVAEKIRSGLRAWKQRSFRPTLDFSRPAHGFVLLVVSSRVALARPDGSLRRFASKVRELWGCNSEDANQGTVHMETLYIERPSDRSIVRFTFSVDFFAAQGDGRWWHDHRVPGGIAFTANSVGHMRRYREWYQEKGDQTEWLLTTAMGTIALAAETPYGKATWLKPVDNGRPVVERLACPFANPASIKPELRDKDWTRYGGHLHTDHSIRSEFFDERPEKSSQVKATEYLQDFAYLYDVDAADHTRFVMGQNVSREEVFAEIGSPDTFVSVVGPRIRDMDGKKGLAGAGPIHPEVQALLQPLQAWALTEEELASHNA